MNMYIMCFFMKGVSYCHMLNTVRFYLKVIKKEIDYDDFRMEQEVSSQNKAILEKYKNNIEDFFTIKNLVYFLFAPTLSY